MKPRNIPLDELIAEFSEEELGDIHQKAEVLALDMMEYRAKKFEQQSLISPELLATGRFFLQSSQRLPSTTPASVSRPSSHAEHSESIDSKDHSN